HDTAIRQDLIINGMLSVLGAGVGLGTALAIFAGSAAGPIGIAFGASLMLGGMTYNAVRTVAKIKEKIELTSGEEFETGLRAALGLNLTYAIQNKLQQYQVADSFKQAFFENQRNQFQFELQPFGYTLHFYIEEMQQAEELPYFHLIDKQTNKYLVYQDIEHHMIAKHLNIFSNSAITLWINVSINHEIEQNKRRFSEQEVRLILQQFPDRYDTEPVKIKEYIPHSQIATNDMILLEENTDNIFLDFADTYSNRHKLFTSNSQKSMVIYTTSLWPRLTHSYDYAESFFRDTYNKAYISGISFNTGNGDDIIIGLKDVANRFEIYDGKKIFIGGNSDDIFIFNNKQFEINKIKYLYGKDGNDSIINTLPIQQNIGLIEPDFFIYNKHNNTSFRGCYIDLENSTVKYLTRPFRTFDYSHHRITSFVSSSNNTSQLVASINNLENASGLNTAHNIIIGNAKDNILAGGNGNVILYGKDGNDTLLLTEGYANGGNGIDRYVIQRYNWTDHIKILPDYRFYNQWHPEQQIFINPSAQKQRFKFNRLFSYNSYVVIDEMSNSDESIIGLEYQLDEIKSLELINSDIILKIEIDASSELNKTAKSVIQIKLKNAYNYHGDGKRFLTHQYNILTQDGFLLTPYLPQLLDSTSYQDVLFEIMYVRKFERHVSAASRF
ncbi:MAG: calcium-binding protein, partial [Arsenophonus sp.]|nr:calcium-binding protein [Arsenophonus sp.]